MQMSEISMNYSSKLKNIQAHESLHLLLRLGWHVKNDIVFDRQDDTAKTQGKLHARISMVIAVKCRKYKNDFLTNSDFFNFQIFGIKF